jgi:hypothetical protein
MLFTHFFSVLTDIFVSTNHQSFPKKSVVFFLFQRREGAEEPCSAVQRAGLVILKTIKLNTAFIIHELGYSTKDEARCFLYEVLVEG